ncbi:TolC family protein [Gallaecimonas sp. GXIMD1310]|uniref:TolC family protein n=1 Tax=Gallaecimonas sp. GXIMD1310 TaxID=3131926 RepID=UPI003249B9C6
MRFLLLSSAIFCTAAQGAADPAMTLAELLRQVPEHNTARPALSRWQQGPVSVQLNRYDSRFGLNKGGDEWELGISVPIAGSGQRQYLTSLDKSLGQQQVLGTALRRLDLTGALRQVLADIALANTEVVQYRHWVASYSALAERQQRAVAAGESGRLGWLLADNALTDAKLALASAKQRLARAEGNYQALTGLADWPAHWQEPVKASDINQHPALKESQLLTNLAEARYQRSEKGAQYPWHAGVSVKQIQGAPGYPDDTQIGLQFSMPLGGGSGEDSADDYLAMQTQQRNLARLQQQLTQQWYQAKAQYENSALALTLTKAKLAKAQQLMAVADAAKAAGEISVSDWQRQYQDFLMVQLQQARLEVQVAASAAQLNQAGGFSW